MYVALHAVRRGLPAAAALSCALVLLTPARAAAQQPPIASAARPAPSVPPAETMPAEIDEMRSTIRALQERVKLLEDRLAADDASPATAPVAAVMTPAADAPALATTEPQEQVALPFFRGTQLTGFVDLYVGQNFNRPLGDTPLRNFDLKHGQFALNLVEVALEKKPTETDRVGFRMDFNFGPAAEIVNSYEPGGQDVFRHVEQAYVSYLAPVGNGLQIDAGKFVTPLGAEVIETRDNWNYSRSLLFALAIPYYHFGGRASYSVNDKLALAGYVVNGWNDVVDNNAAKTFGVQAIVKPTTKLTIVQNYMAGAEQPDDNHDVRHLVDTTVTYAVNPAVNVMANYDYGRDRVAGAGVHWQGLALYGRVQASSWLAFTPRFEWYDDHDGFTTGTRQTLHEFTFTSEQKLGEGFLTRLEFRRDFSDRDFFPDNDGRLRRGQNTFTLGILYAFDSMSAK